MRFNSKKIMTNYRKMRPFSQLFILFILLLGVNHLSAQVGRITSTSISYEEQMVAALTVSVKPARKDIQQAFDDWLDDRYDVNMKGGGLFGDKNLRSAEAIMIPTISAENISLFVRTEERGGKTHMTMFASRGLGNFIGLNEEKAFSGLEEVFDGFLSFYLPEYYEERVVEAQEALAELRDEFSDTERDITKNEKEIKKLQVENAELRQELKSLERDIDAAERLLEKRKDARLAVKRNRD